MKTIGITGIIGSGKSAACSILKRLGFAVIDADRVGHEVLRSSKQVRQKVKKSFGTTARSKLARIVFDHPQKLAELNKIIHPEMKKRIAARIKTLKKKRLKGIVLEAAILLRMGLEGLIDELWVINTSKDNIRRRLKNKLSPNELERRLKNAYPLKKMLKKADVALPNNGAMNVLRKRIKKIVDT